MTPTKSKRLGGRKVGSGNIPPLEKIRANRHKLEKMLLDKAMAGDVEAIKACIDILDSQPSVKSKSLRERVTPQPT